ncbi:MAG: hypothetical protein OSB41_00925 [Kiritimatiellae bacterium]|nr:hypothetical protein [Kiritimatiellia bacterium]
MSEQMKNLDTKKAQGLSLKVGIAGLALFVVALFFDKTRSQAFESYLLSFAFIASFGLGSLFLLLLQNVCGGRWGISIRRLLEAAAGTLPFTALLLIPIFLGMSSLYEWARPEAAHDHVIQLKAAYLNVPAFILRSVIFFAIWSFIVNRLLTWTRAEDRGDALASAKFGMFSAPCIVIYALTMTFASFDWLMSIEAHWFSTMFGVRYGAGAALGSIALAVIVLNKIKDIEPIKSVVRFQLCSDLGNLMLAFTMFWAYVSFSEFLIIWSANLPEERFWYAERLQGGWQVLSLALIISHFFIPFLFLMNRSIKKRLDRLAKLAVFILFARFLDFAWTVIPSFHTEGMRIHLLDVTTFFGLLGIWLFVYFRGLSSRPLIAALSPRMKEVLGDGHHD